jgi:putative zinc finger protein
VTAAAGDCATWRDSIAAHALGALEPAEAAAVDRHLAACPDCGLEFRRLAVLPPLLDLVGDATAPQERPPASLEEAVLDNIARHQRAARAAGAGRTRLHGPWRRRPVAIGLGGAAVGAAAAVAALIGPGLGGDGPLGYRLTPSALAPGASADARLTPEATGTSVRLRVRGMPRIGRDAVYELRFSRAGEGISAGTFRVGPEGGADVRMTTAADLGEYRVMRVILVRPEAGRVHRGAVLLTGRL